MHYALDAFALLFALVAFYFAVQSYAIREAEEWEPATEALPNIDDAIPDHWRYW